MLIVGIIVLLILSILWLLSRECNVEYFKQLDKKDDPFRMLYPLILYVKTVVSKIFVVKKQKKRIFEELYLIRAEEMQTLHFYRKVSLVIIVGILSLILSIIADFSMSDGIIIKDEIIRPMVGKGESSINIMYESGNGFIGNIDVKVSEKQLSGKSLDLLFQKAKEYIDSEILGSNTSFNDVTSDLVLKESIPSMSMKLTWNVSDSTYVNSQGKVLNDNLDEEGIMVELKAVMTYYEHETLYSRWVHIMPKRYSEKELFDKTLQETLNEIDVSTREEDAFKLPKKIDEYTLIWNLEEESSGKYILILGLVASACVMIGMETSLKSKQKHRNLQMLIDYPEIISKFTLLLNAGMTIRAAFERITYDYLKKKKRDANREKKNREIKEREVERYAYEELVLVVRELELGKPEAMVYDAFGQRCSLMCYLRFSTIIVQNMKKGTKGIVPMLELEALDAFAERKETAKRLGEEAGTKLLGPMVGMLFIVLLIVLVPAFLNFSF